MLKDDWASFPNKMPPFFIYGRTLVSLTMPQRSYYLFCLLCVYIQSQLGLLFANQTKGRLEIKLGRLRTA
eukprot:4070870-Amphidinium_carterae.1